MAAIAPELLQRREDWRSALAVFAHLSFVFAPILLAAWFGTWPWIVGGAVWFGLTQAGVANLMHEAAHRLLFRSSRWSDNLGAWVLAPSFFSNFELYRKRHWIHHHHVGDELDTKRTYLIQLRGAGGVALFAVRCLLLIEGAKRFLQTGASNPEVAPLTSAEVRAWVFGVVRFQLLFAAALFGVAWAGSPGDIEAAALHAVMAYFAVYLFGMAAGATFVSTLRAVAEHQIGGPGGREVGKAGLRNLKPDAPAWLLFGCYGFFEHGTHHDYPQVPYYNLPKATRQLKDGGGPGYGPSYWGTIVEIVSRRPQAAQRSAAE